MVKAPTPKKPILLSAGMLGLIMIIGTLAWLHGNATRSTPRSADLDVKLQSIVSDLVANDSSIKNCALSVMKGDGSLVWSGAAGKAHGQAPMTESTPIYIASVTKLYTATVLMLLDERDLLSLDDPMAKYLPSELIRGIHIYAGTDYSNEITLRDLLGHRSGIADYYDEKSSDGKSMFERFLENPDRRWTVDEMITRAREELRPKFPPGTDTSYSDTNFQLLGKVIEAATGKSLHAAYEDFIFRPLGLDHTWLVGFPRVRSITDPADVFSGDRNITAIRSNGAYWADGGIVSTVREMNLFLKALNQGRLVRRDTLAKMHDWHKWRFPLKYGLGTMYFALPQPIALLAALPPLWGHSGSTGSFLYYDEDLDLYLAGSIDQTESELKPFSLMRNAIGVIASR